MVSENEHFKNWKIIIGCEGLRTKNFVFCPSCENTFLLSHDFAEIQSSNIIFSIKKMSPSLLEKGYIDGIVAKNIINVIHTKIAPISDEKLSNFQMFCSIHKQCNIYLKLEK